MNRSLIRPGNIPISQIPDPFPAFSVFRVFFRPLVVRVSPRKILKATGQWSNSRQLSDMMPKMGAIDKKLASCMILICNAFHFVYYYFHR